MLIKQRTYRRLLRAIFKLHTNKNCVDLIDIIVSKIVCDNAGASRYARARRAKSIGRCPRCFRCSPGFSFTKNCDSKTCVPGISYNVKVKDFIVNGVTM
ncbi:nucleic acid binding protein [Garlic latent virus]|uniref:RNA silencing suppressor n=1 Tax=Garlic latent virus TaxID=12458 RepID=Q8QXY3_9VIRU|nr:nucleic acid binding protein [Garlic latent virus]CAC83719.1 nucleic acid binding protein [Garlic latent virus]